MIELTVFILGFSLSYAGVAMFRRWSIRHGILDKPNERSSHSQPTPRGGGLAIAAVSLAAYVFAAYFTDSYLSWAYIAGALIIVIVSWIDDLYSVPPLYRLVCHIAAALILVGEIGFIGGIGPSGNEYPLRLVILGGLVAVFWIVWMINAYNFMDGIDGIAGLQAVIGGIGWSIIAVYYSVPGIHIFALAVAAASLGFLIQNWQPARVFLGDAGSAFLGYTFAALPILAIVAQPLKAPDFAAIGILIVWFFIFDSVLTMSFRFFKRRGVWHAHREHIYQRLVIAGFSHAVVTAIYGFLAFIVIATLIYAVASGGISYLLPVFFTSVFSLLLCGWVLRQKLIG